MGSCSSKQLASTCAGTGPSVPTSSNSRICSKSENMSKWPSKRRRKRAVAGGLICCIADEVVQNKQRIVSHIHKEKSQSCSYVTQFSSSKSLHDDPTSPAIASASCRVLSSTSLQSNSGNDGNCDTNSSMYPNQPHECDKSQATFSSDYQILPRAVLGLGLAGYVRKCIHIPTSELRAVKTVRKSRIKKNDRIKEEVRILKKLHHPNIIRLHDVHEGDSEMHIVTEICHGGELFDRIVEKARLSNKQRRSGGGAGDQGLPACYREEDAAQIIRSLLSAVRYLHSDNVNVVHRDLKPDNILFAERGDDASQIRLIDFGLATRHTPGCPPLTARVGTPYYMAPELLEGNYGRSCDMWSVGVIAYVMLSGRPPFGGAADDLIFEKILRGRYRMEGSWPWDRGISEEAKDFIRRLLDTDPRRRWTADMALDHAWLKLAKSGPEMSSE